MKKINYKMCLLGFMTSAVMMTSSTYAMPVATSSESAWGTVSTGVGDSGVSGVVITAPIPSPLAGTYISTQSVSLQASGALSIHYTIDGTTPTCSTGLVYSSPVSVTSSQTVLALSCYANSVASGVSTFVYIISAPSIGGGGGGGGGGGSASYTPVTNSTTTATTTPVSTGSLVAGCTGITGFSVTTGQSCSQQGRSGQVGSVLGVSAFNFTLDLGLGSQNNDVTELQKVLIKDGFLKSGATGYFGAMTRAALMKWQEKNGLVVSEIFGKEDRDFLNGKNGITGNIIVKQTVNTKRFLFLKDLKLGSRSNDVKELQKILIAAKMLPVYPPTEYFGALTQSALKKWQTANGVPVTGFLDVASRVYLNNK